MTEFDVEGGAFLPLREVVYLSLRKAILKEQLKPGERLMENTLAAKLGVSRTPVREAIRMLSDEGLVLLIPRRGAQVARISRKELNDVLEVRRSLEDLAIRKAALLIKEEDLAALEEAELAFRSAVKSGDLTTIAEADIAFHDVIYAAAGNRRLLTILSNLREQMYRFRLEYLKQVDIAATLVGEHAAIAAAVRERDPEKASKLLCAHIDNQRMVIDRILGDGEAS